MKFAGIIQKSLTEWTGHTSTVLLVKGCDLKCGYCDQAFLASGIGTTMEGEELFEHLLENQKEINHVVITGGEPGVHERELVMFIIKLKNAGFKVKVHTNGTNPHFVRRLVSYNPMVDAIAMDIKTVLDLSEYKKVCGECVTDIMLDNIRESIEVISCSGVEKEFISTIAMNYHYKETIKKLAAMNLRDHYFRMVRKNKFLFDEDVESYNEHELKALIDEINRVRRYPIILLP